MILFIIAVLIMLTGILGVIVPIIPGLVLTWMGAFVYAFFTDFTRISWTELIILGGIVAFSFLIDFVANIWGVRKFGASAFGMMGTVIGGAIGVLIGGIFGLIIGAFLGAFMFEFAKNNSLRKSIKISLGTLLGFFVGTFIKFILGIIMLGLFVFWAL